MLQELRKSHPQLPLVLIATDDIADQAMAGKVLAKYGMETEESWIFADGNPQKLRYEIDPAWYGEMPRAYFYDAAHGREAVSGTVERAKIEAWLAGKGSDARRACPSDRVSTTPANPSRRAPSAGRWFMAASRTRAAIAAPSPTERRVNHEISLGVQAVPDPAGPEVFQSAHTGHVSGGMAQFGQNSRLHAIEHP